MQIITVYTFKGGTGKTTSAYNISDCLARKGKSTLLVDLDSQRTLSAFAQHDGLAENNVFNWLSGETVDPICLDKQKPYKLWLIPGSFHVNQVDVSRRNIILAAIERLTKVQQFDYIVIDCATGVLPLNVQAILAADRVLIPTLSEMASLKGLAETANLIRGDEATASKAIDVIRTRYKKQLRLTREADTLLREGASEIGFNLIQQAIPENVEVAQASNAGEPVTSYAKSSKGATAYRLMTNEMLKLWRSDQ